MAAVYQDPVHYETDDGEWEEIDNRFTLSRDGAHCGLYYTASRYYDPEAGRFLSPDALDTLTASPSSLTDKNLYAYCDNNPVMRQDSSGEFWSLIKGAVCVAVMEDSKPSKASQKNSSNKNIRKTKTSRGTSKNTKRKRRLHRYTYTAYTRDGRKTTGYGYYYF